MSKNANEITGEIDLREMMHSRKDMCPCNEKYTVVDISSPKWKTSLCIAFGCMNSEGRILTKQPRGPTNAMEVLVECLSSSSIMAVTKRCSAGIRMPKQKCCCFYRTNKKE